MTAVIGIGDVRDGSTLVVSWYRVEGTGEREALFSHDISLGSGGEAFSTAVAPGGIAPGIYDVEAALDDHVIHTPAVVLDAASPNVVSGDAATGDEGSSLPESGEAGWSDGVGPPPEQTPTDTCTLDSIDPGMVPVDNVAASAWLLGPCTTGSLSATVSGPPTLLASSDSLEGPRSGLYGATGVCRLSGGSDLPGTVVHFEVTGSASGSQDYTLPDHGGSLAVALEGSPESGSEVGAGDAIDIEAVAMALSPALGVKTLYVDDGNDLLGSVGNVSGSDELRACDPGREYALLRDDVSGPGRPGAGDRALRHRPRLRRDGVEGLHPLLHRPGVVGGGEPHVIRGVPGRRDLHRRGRDRLHVRRRRRWRDHGSGLAAHTEAANCPFPTRDQWETRPLTVTGRLEGQTIHLEFALAGSFDPAGGIDFGGFGTSVALGGGTVDLAIQGTSAAGTAAFSRQSGNPPATYSASGPVTATCVNACGSG